MGPPFAKPKAGGRKTGPRYARRLRYLSAPRSHPPPAFATPDSSDKRAAMHDWRKDIQRDALWKRMREIAFVFTLGCALVVLLALLIPAS